MTKESPIIFDSESITAILEGRKTQTRQVLGDKVISKTISLTDVQSGWTCFTPPKHISIRGFFKEGHGEKFIKLKYGKSGDLLWVRELYTWKSDPDFIFELEGQDEIIFKQQSPEHKPFDGKWRIFIPKDKARIWLKIKAIRVERLQEITTEDIEAEGINIPHLDDELNRNIIDNIEFTMQYKNFFGLRWDSINAKRGYTWESNPFVWVITFEREVKGNG